MTSKGSWGNSRRSPRKYVTDHFKPIYHIFQLFFKPKEVRYRPRLRPRVDTRTHLFVRWGCFTLPSSISSTDTRMSSTCFLFPVFRRIIRFRHFGRNTFSCRCFLFRPPPPPALSVSLSLCLSLSARAQVRNKQQFVTNHEASMRDVEESKTMKTRALARTTEKVRRKVKTDLKKELLHLRIPYPHGSVCVCVLIFLL